MVDKVQSLDIDAVTELLRVIEFYFIVENQNSRLQQEESFQTNEFVQYIRSNPNSKIGFQRTLLQQIYE